MQQDYILRLIERIGVLFAAIRKLIIGRGDPEEIQADLEAAAGMAGFDLDIVRALDLDSLLNAAGPGGEIDISRIWLMAELLLLDGLQDANLGETSNAESKLTRSRALFELLGTKASMVREFPEAQERISDIDEALEGLDAAAR